jgi:large subunit ribosomal protein L3
MPETASVQDAPPLPALKSILGQKVGMTQIFDAQGQMIPVTVVVAGPCHVTQVLSKAKQGYDALQVSFGAVNERNVCKAAAGIAKHANVPPARWHREFRTEKAELFQVGQALTVAAFVPGDIVDVRGLSKGKGFAGAMKRHNFGGGPSTHGQSDRMRAPGSSGSNTYPGRVLKGKRFPGHLGSAAITVQNLEIVGVDAQKNLIFVRGAVPGPRENLLIIEQTVKRVKFRAAHVPEPKKEKAGKKESVKGAPAKAKGGKA